MERRNWTRDELIVAFNLYCKIPFGKINNRNPQIIKLANAIGRTPSAVSWKLANFASFDPSLQKRQIRGATNAGKLDKAIFGEFYNNWEDLAYESEMLLHNFFKEPFLENHSEGNDDFAFPEGKVRESIVKIRVNQAFFRSTVLAAYDNRCCITGIALTELLVASHIVPWSKDTKNRLNPENGLCLNALHDRAFDQGLITIDDNYQIKVSSTLRAMGSKAKTNHFFMAFDAQQIQLPKRFLPSKQLPKYHQETVFKG